METHAKRSYPGTEAEYRAARAEYNEQTRAAREAVGAATDDASLWREWIADYVSNNLLHNQAAIDLFVLEATGPASGLFGWIQHQIRKMDARRRMAKGAATPAEMALLNAERMYIKAFGRANKNVDHNVMRDTQYVLTAFQPSDELFSQNKQAVAQMENVVVLTGEEFPKSEESLKSRVAEYYNGLGGTVYNPELGDVNLSASGINDDMRHGMSYLKGVTFAAVPNVIENGRVVQYSRNWEGRGYNTAVIAAPISINNDPYIVGARIIRREEQGTQRHYIHEVVAINVNESSVAFTSRLTADEDGAPRATDDSSIKMLLREIIDVKLQMQNGVAVSADQESGGAPGASRPTAEAQDYSLNTPSWEEFIQGRELKKQGREPRANDERMPENTDNGRVRNFARTAMETFDTNTPEGREAVSRMQNAVILQSGDYVYEPMSNNHLRKKAVREITTLGGTDAALKTFLENRISLGDVGRGQLALHVAVGEQLLKELALRGDVNNALEVAANLAVWGTELGQGVQALNLLKSMQGKGSLFYMEKMIDRLNDLWGILLVKRVPPVGATPCGYPTGYPCRNELCSSLISIPT